MTEWISVQDKMPEPMERVLGYCLSNEVKIVRYDHVMCGWDVFIPTCSYMLEYITHWMPLPPRPEGE